MASTRYARLAATGDSEGLAMEVEGNRSQEWTTSTTTRRRRKIRLARRSLGDKLVEEGADGIHTRSISLNRGTSEKPSGGTCSVAEGKEVGGQGD